MDTATVTKGTDWLGNVKTSLPPETAYWADAIFEELPEVDAQTFAAEFRKSSHAAAGAVVHARMMLWMFESEQHGFLRASAVKSDAELVGYIKRLCDVCHRQEKGEQVLQDELKKLGEEIANAWSSAGERKRVSLMTFARRFAWLGARRFAWLGKRPWSAAWTTLLSATRPLSRGTVASSLLSWAGAWTLRRIRAGYDRRMIVARDYFLQALNA